MTRLSDTRPTLALGEPDTPNGLPTVIVALPDTFWLDLKPGHATSFDLTHCGVRAQLVVFRAHSGAHVAELLGQAQDLLDSAKDVGIPEPTKQ